MSALRTPSSGEHDHANLLSVLLTGLRPSTLKGYKKDLISFSRYCGGESPTRTLQELFTLPYAEANRLVSNYRADAESIGLAPATIARRISALRFSVRRGRIAGLTILALDSPRPLVTPIRDNDGPGESDWRRLLDAATSDATASPEKGRELSMILLIYHQAIRPGALVTLDLVDVDLETPAIFARGRWLKITDSTRDGLKRWIEHRGSWPGPLFTRIDNACTDPTRLTVDSVTRCVKNLCQRAGLPLNINANSLRHAALARMASLSPSPRRS